MKRPGETPIDPSVLKREKEYDKETLKEFLNHLKRMGKLEDEIPEDATLEALERLYDKAEFRAGQSRRISSEEMKEILTAGLYRVVEEPKDTHINFRAGTSFYLDNPPYRPKDLKSLCKLKTEELGRLSTSRFRAINASDTGAGAGTTQEREEQKKPAKDQTSQVTHQSKSIIM